jgi:hypothetical protein
MVTRDSGTTDTAGSDSRRISALPGRRICAEQAVRRDGGRICANLRLAQGQQVDRARQTDGGSGGRSADSRSTGRDRGRIRRTAGCAGRRRGRRGCADGADVRESGRRMRRDGESSRKRRPVGRDGGQEKAATAAGKRGPRPRRRPGGQHSDGDEKKLDQGGLRRKP